MQVVTGKFQKTAELYPSVTPIMQSNSGQKVIVGRKNLFIIQGQKFGPTAGDNTVSLDCAGTPIDGVIVTSATTTSLSVEISSENWSCKGGAINGIVTTASGFASAPVQVGTALDGAESGNFVVDANGVVQVAPSTLEEKKALCGGFSNIVDAAEAEKGCSAIEFCKYDVATGTCGATGLDAGIVLLIIFIVLAVVVLVVFLVLKQRNGGGGGGGGQSNLPTAATVAVPGPPPNKPSKQRPLQPFWKEQVDPGSGESYYYNTDTSELNVCNTLLLLLQDGCF